MYATVVEVDGDDVVLEVAPGVEVRYCGAPSWRLSSPARSPRATSLNGYYEEAQDEENAGTPEDSDGIKSADDGLADSPDDLAKSDKDNVH